MMFRSISALLLLLTANQMVVADTVLASECSTLYRFDCDDDQDFCMFHDCVNGICPEDAKDTTALTDTYNGIGPIPPGPGFGTTEFDNSQTTVCKVSRDCDGCDDFLQRSVCQLPEAAPSVNSEVWVDYTSDFDVLCGDPM